MRLLQDCRDPYTRCAIYGAALTVSGLKKTAVVVHAPQGCLLSVSSAYSYQNVDFTNKLLACSKLCEIDVVTGGELKLSNTLRTVADAYNVDLIMVLTGCAPEIIGDDVQAIVNKIQNDIESRVIPIASGGFHGSEEVGIDISLQTLLEHFAIPSEKRKERSVNLVAPFASANPGWMADLSWIRNILSKMDISVNAVLCSDTSISDIENAGAAEANILLSHNAGHRACQFMEESLDIPFILQNLPLPVGLNCTAKWLEAVGEYFGKEKKIGKIIEREEERVVKTLRLRYLPIQWLHQHPTSVIGDMTIGIGLVDFITRELEMDPQLICIRKANPDARTILESVIKDLRINPKIIYDADISTVKTTLKDTMPTSVFGSIVEKHLCRELGIKFVYRLFDNVDRIDYFDYPYMGYDGTLKMLEFTLNNWRNKMTGEI